MKRRKLRDKGSPHRPVPPLSPFASEQVLRDIQRIIGDRVFESMDEANSFFQALKGPRLKEALKEAPARSQKEEAQDLAYAAMEAPDRPGALSFAQQALAKDPDCVDALAVLAGATAHSPEDFIAGLEKAVSVGERVLGEKFFEANRDHFWGQIEARPYMRTRRDLADALLKVGRVSEAVAHFEALLELNPSDNQGVRYSLLGLYLEENDLDHTRRLLLQYPESSSAVFNWGRVLERFLSGDLRGAEQALRKARAQNRFVEQYLTARRKFPQRAPDSYIVGSEEEALFCLEQLARACARHPEILVWMRDAISRDPMAS